MDGCFVSRNIVDVKNTEFNIDFDETFRFTFMPLI